jgi:hypothetical protein
MWRYVCISAAVLWAASAAADELSARYEQQSLNSEALLNDAVFSGAWQNVFTESLTDEMDVMQRPRPAFQAEGVPAGGFVLLPALVAGGGYNDNVFATPDQRRGDLHADIGTSLALRSQWKDDLLSIYAGSNSTAYDRFSSESINDWDTGVAARIVVADGVSLRANGFYDQLHEPRSSADEAGSAAEPTAFSLLHGDIAVDDKAGAFAFTAGNAFDEYRYSPTALIGGGVFDNGGRDEKVDTLFSRATFEVSQQSWVFAGASYESRDFLRQEDGFGYDRDSHGWRIDAGLQFIVSRTVQGQVFAGYAAQSFKAPLGNLDTPDYGATLDWYVSPVWTLRAELDHAIDDTTVPGTAASNDTTALVSLDHEIEADLLLDVRAGLTHESFIGTGRRDDAPGAGFTITWLVNRMLSLSAQYQWAGRSSDIPGLDYSQNSIFLSTRVQL